ncbi:MAG: ATP-binding protein, partial [Nitrospira sp.]
LIFVTVSVTDVIVPLSTASAIEQQTALSSIPLRADQILFIMIGVGLVIIAMVIYHIRTLAHRLTRERHLRQHADTLARAIEQTQDAVLITDRQGTITYVNPAFTKLTGYTVQEAIGRTPGSLLKSGKQDQTFYEMVWETILAGNTWQGILTNRKKSGDLYIANESISPLYDPDSKIIVSFVAVQQDITEQQKAQQRLHQAEKLEAIGQLAGSIAHDFNNLLTPILGHAELLTRLLTPDNRALHHLTEIQGAARRAATLTRQLLTFTRHRETIDEIVDINDLLTGLLPLLTQTVGEHIELQFIPAHTIGKIKGEKSQLETAILNLVLNARDAMPNGGRVTLKTDTAVVGQADFPRPTDTMPGPYVRLSISDTGHGMTPDVQAKIFEPFFTTKEEHKGTGLGLPMVHRVVTTMGGFLNVTSEPGRGTTFDLYFPQISQDIKPTDIPATDKPLELCTGHETILLVEDDDAVRTLASFILQECGYHVLEAHDGETALQVADNYEGTIHLLVTDIRLPKHNGPQLAQMLRQRRPTMKVLYVSGFADSFLVQPTPSLQPMAYLPKPYTPSSLAHHVRAVLEQPSFFH